MIHPDPESYHEIPHPSSLFLRQATEESNNHLNVFKNKYFVLKCLEDISPFCGATDTPVFGLLVMFALGFKACLCALLPAHNRILRFTSGATPADLLAASMAAKLFSPIYLWTSIGGAWDQDLSCVLLPQWPGRHSNDWTMLARLYLRKSTRMYLSSSQYKTCLAETIVDFLFRNYNRLLIHSPSVYATTHRCTKLWKWLDPGCAPSQIEALV